RPGRHQRPRPTYRQFAPPADHTARLQVPGVVEADQGRRSIGVPLHDGDRAVVMFPRIRMSHETPVWADRPCWCSLSRCGTGSAGGNSWLMVAVNGVLESCGPLPLAEVRVVLREACEE